MLILRWVLMASPTGTGLAGRRSLQAHSRFRYAQLRCNDGKRWVLMASPTGTGLSGRRSLQAHSRFRCAQLRCNDGKGWVLMASPTGTGLAGSFAFNVVELPFASRLQSPGWGVAGGIVGRWWFHIPRRQRSPDIVERVCHDAISWRFEICKISNWSQECGTVDASCGYDYSVGTCLWHVWINPPINTSQSDVPALSYYCVGFCGVLIRLQWALQSLET